MKKIVKKRKALSPQQIKFAEEYAISGNGLEAATKAGYTYNTSNKALHTLLGNLGIQEIIQKRQAERAKKHDITADKLIEEARMVLEEAKQFKKYGKIGLGYRLEAVDKLSKLTGSYAETKHKILGSKDEPLVIKHTRVMLFDENENAEETANNLLPSAEIISEAV